jgi:hypothetical protein
VFRKTANFMDAPWPRNDPDPVSQREQRFLICLALSILIHGGVLLVHFQENLGGVVAQSRTGERGERLTVRLNHVPQPETQVAAAPPPPKAQLPRPAPRRPPSPPVLALPPTAAPTPSPFAVAPPPVPQRDNAPPVDMMAMVNAARARRRALDDAAARDNAAAAAGEREASASEVATANLNRNLQTLNRKEGISGVFTILSVGSRVSTFAFRGWTASERDSTRQVIEVDAGNLGNVELATVRRMIQLIRTHYSGDFNWESHRLGGVRVMSARPADNAELEAFLMDEFREQFGGSR